MSRRHSSDNARQNPSSRHARGVACALAGAALWGFSGACAQFVLAYDGVDPVFVTAVRALVASACFLGFAVFRERAAFRRLLGSRRALAAVLVFGVALYLDQVTYTFSVEATNAGTATVLQSLSIALILLVACVRGKKLPSKVEGVGLAFALASTWLIATQGDWSRLALPANGLAWGLANAVSVVVYVMWPQRLYARYGSFPVIAAGMVANTAVAVAVWLGGAAAAGSLTAPALDAAGWAILVVGVGVLGTFASFGLYLHGVSVVGSVEGGLLGAVEPASAAVFAAVWLGTAMSGADWVGLVLMIAMIVLVSLGEGKREKG